MMRIRDAKIIDKLSESFDEHDQQAILGWVCGGFQDLLVDLVRAQRSAREERTAVRL
jgi:hypothetical protein